MTDRAGVLAEARAELWRRGDLRWKLHVEQQAIYDDIKAVKARGGSRYVLEIARRFGKTWLLAVLAIETCLARPKSRVVFGAPSLKHLGEFVLPTFEAITADAPVDCKPTFNTASGHWRFPSGSWVHLFGASDKLQASRGRGAESELNIFDEAGFSPVLDYVLDDVFKATTMHSGGMMLLGSTPADTPDHPFTAIAERAERDGYYSRKTIFQNPRLSKERIGAFIAEGAAEQGLSVDEYRQTPTFRREYLAERVVDERMVIVSEWAEKRDKLFVAVERPEFFNGMTVLDFGGADPHAAVFAYWHFALAKWVIEDELLLRNGENTADLAQAIKAKEQELWGTRRWEGTLRGVSEKPTDALLANLPDYMREALDKEAPQQPMTRWADNDLQLVRDLYDLHRLLFVPTAKDDLQMQVNNLRVMLRAEEVLIHPRCRNTDRHLLGATWENQNRKTFKRRGGEHADLLAALIYGARNLDRRNPMPADWGVQPGQRLSVREAVVREEDRRRMERTFLGTGPLAAKIIAGRRR